MVTGILFARIDQEPILPIKVPVTTTIIKFDECRAGYSRVFFFYVTFNRPLVMGKQRNWAPDTVVYWAEDSDEALRTWYNV